jgi:DNA invertase Pin-like site-specific DNA recombinase
VSGSGKKQRAQFERMMLDASQKKFDVLVFWALDRLSREGIVKTISYLEQLKGWNVGWRSYTQPFLDTGNSMVNDIVLSVLAAVAKQERITISERTLAGLQRARKAGKVLGRRPVRVDVAQARRMQREGLGLRPIAAKLGIAVNTLRGALVGDCAAKKEGSAEPRTRPLSSPSSHVPAGPDSTPPGADAIWA